MLFGNLLFPLTYNGENVVTVLMNPGFVESEKNPQACPLQRDQIKEKVSATLLQAHIQRGETNVKSHSYRIGVLVSTSLYWPVL